MNWSELAARARREMDRSGGGAAKEPYSRAARAALAGLTEAIIADGVDREAAEYAVTRWIFTLDLIEECVRQEIESRSPRWGQVHRP